jgi:hypothetical protein
LQRAQEGPGERRTGSRSTARLIVTHDVRALARVALAARPVPAAVDHAANGRDPEVSVPQRQVLRQLRCAALDVEAFISRAPGGVCAAVHRFTASPVATLPRSSARDFLPWQERHSGCVFARANGSPPRSSGMM